MSNLAYKVERQQRQTAKAEPSVIIRRRASITLGEKVLIVLLAVALFSASLFLISQIYVSYQKNIEIQQLNNKYEAEKNRVGDLEKRANELKAPDRIIRTAKEKGLKFGDKKVKNVQE
ncbi:cell division protein FtsL [Bacillus changyiensis]|uniref:cell division protein FtsL n=1 Tax=Bacillus changyiensis TaxID=3004103 RepID=UPI0022E40708|nr:cell division protein FtsL [Bacillus changyiensis]MDA1475650.1 cell division protein FtsL [Bacillus changyiensis]